MMEETLDNSRAAAAGAVIPRDALIAGAMLIWAAVIAVATYSFHSADALRAFDEYRHYLPDVFSRLPDNLRYVLPVLAFLASSFGPGDALLAMVKVPLTTRVSRIAFALLVGLIVWTLAVIVVGIAGYLIAPVLYALFAVAAAASIFRARNLFSKPSAQADADPQGGGYRVLAWVIGALLLFDLYFALLGALGRETGFDARYYHLAEAIRYAEHGSFFDLVGATHSISMGLYQYQETLYSAVIVMFGLPAAKILSWSNLLLSMLAIFAFASEFFRSRFVALLASLLFVSTPIVAWSSTTANNDLTPVAFTVLALFAFLRWKHDRHTGWLWVMGALCGYTFGVKLFGGFTIAALVVFIVALLLSELLMRNSQKRLGAKDALSALGAITPFAAAALIVALPSIIRTTIMTWNPLFPAATSIFHTRYWAQMTGVLSAGYQPRTLFDLIRLPWVVAIDSDRYRQIVGPTFLFAFPFVLVACFSKNLRPVVRITLAFVLLWFAFWYAAGTLSMRYAQPVYPLFAIVIAYFAFRFKQDNEIFNGAWARGTFLAVLLAGIVLNSQIFVPFQNHALERGNMGLAHISWGTLYYGEPDDMTPQYAPMLHYINEHLDPRRDKVYDGSDSFVNAFNSYSFIDLYDGSNLEAPVDWNLLSSDAYEHLRQNDIDYVMVFQKDVPALSRSPLFPHLKIVTSVPPSVLYRGYPSGYGQVLYRVE